MSRNLLREFILEVLGSPSPSSAGKDEHAGNLYGLGRTMPAAGIRGRGDGVLDDEKNEEDADKQKPRAACCLVIADDGKILAVSRKDNPSLFGFPGGHVDPGEDAETAAARELEEETGLIATKLSKVFSQVDGQGFETTTFACEVEGKINTDEEGVIRWVHPSVLIDPASSPFVDYNEQLFDHLGIETE